MDRIKFFRDIAFPENNSDIYRNIYVIEQWLRRIAHTTLFLRHGENWVDGIPPDILSTLKQRRGNLKGRIILDCENNRNIVWLTTLDELVRLLTKEEHWNIVQLLTGYPQNDFEEWINILREIRNIVGHNRATTFQTLNICNGVITYLNKGIKRFKEDAIYINKMHPDDEFFHEGYGRDSEITYIKKNYLYEITSFDFPEPRELPFINIPLILSLFKPLENIILAITVQIKGQVYSVLWTKNLSERYKDDILKIMKEAEFTVWGSENYIKQSAKHLCDPKIWFYNDESELESTDTTKEEDLDMENKTHNPGNIIQFPTT